MRRHGTRTLLPTASHLGLSAAIVRLERRKSQRLVMRMPAKYRLVDNGQSWSPAILQDMGGNGLQLNVRNPLRGSPLIEVLFLLDRAKPLKATCQVSWRKRLPNGTMDLGMMFLAIDEPQRFVECLCEQILERGLMQSMLDEITSSSQGAHELRTP